MEKKIFKNNKNNIHLGINAPSKDFVSATVSDVKKILSNISKNKLWRCNVCNDLHIGVEPPKECPTCHALNAYVEINMQEFKILMGI